MKRRLVLLVAAVLLLTGCAGYEWVQVPPKVEVGGNGTVAVLFFDNFTDDYALSYEVEQEIVRILSGYYRVLGPQEVEWALVRLGLMRGEVPSRDQVIRLGQMLGVDAVVTGEVSGYFDPINQTQPYPTGRTQTDEQGRIYRQYEFLETTQVMVSFSARVMDTRSGNVIHRQRVQGEYSSERKEIIRFPREWWPEGRVPSTWDLPRVSQQDLRYVREVAIREAVSSFTADLMPTRVWRKVGE